MGKTNLNNLPYPEPRDKPDVAGDIKALAEALDTANLGGSGGGVACYQTWDELVNCTPTGGVACFPTYGDLKDCTPTGGGPGGGSVCFTSYEDLDNCTPTGGGTVGNVVLLGAAKEPSHFVGEFRPDLKGGHSDPEWDMLQNAEEGSTYTCTNSETYVPGGNWGARFWRKKDTRWFAEEGDTGWVVVWAWDQGYGVGWHALSGESEPPGNGGGKETPTVDGGLGQGCVIKVRRNGPTISWGISGWWDIGDAVTPLVKADGNRAPEWCYWYEPGAVGLILGTGGTKPRGEEMQVNRNALYVAAAEPSVGLITIHGLMTFHVETHYDHAITHTWPTDGLVFAQTPRTGLEGENNG